MLSDTCLFCSIIMGKIPSKKVYEDEMLYAFHDINPQADVHVLIIPKHHIEQLSDAQAHHASMLGRMLEKAGHIARLCGCSDGFRAIINDGRIGQQEVQHVHLHILANARPLGSMLPK